MWETKLARLAHVCLLRCLAAVIIASCAMLTAPARATELHTGARVGGLQMGVDPRWAFSVYGGLAWRGEHGLAFELSNVFSLSPGRTWGVYDRTAAALGYGGKNGKISLGPSLSFFSMPACNFVICDRVNGIAVGGQLDGAWYFSGPFGLSAHASVEGWKGGDSHVLPGALVIMAMAGPALRFDVSRNQ